MKRTILVTIDPVGRPTIEAQGFTGSSCKEATKPIEDAFKGAEMETTNKPEMHLGSSTKGEKHLQI